MTHHQRRHVLAQLLLSDRAFQGGLVLRLALIFFAVPLTHSDWFVPFLQIGIQNPFDPWGANAAQSSTGAFPYGWAMYALTIPGVVVGSLIDKLLGSEYFAFVGLGLTVLAVDLLLFSLLLSLIPEQQKRLLVLYWLSPIVLYICYWHGQLDIVPVVLLVLSLLLIFRQRPVASGVVMATAISAKLSIALAPPFILLFLGLSKRRRSLLLPYIAAGAVSSAILQLPILLSHASRAMIFGTPEINKVYDFSIRLSDGLEVYLVPVVYILLLFSAWQVRRINAQLLMALIGVAFIAIVLMTPASPGWYLWVVPFLTIFATSRLRMMAFVVFYGCLFVSFHILRSSGSAVPLFGLDLTEPLANTLALPDRILSIWLSLLFGAGVILSALLLREGVLRNDYYKLSRRPLLIGIAGDSGTGKDTLAEALIGLVGRETATHISGDDYHRWDRHKPMWQVMTHLNPQANDLANFKQDILGLVYGAWIRNRHYDHTLGRMTKPRTIFSNDVIIASGLHTLYDPELSATCDVRIFLDMDDDLRKFVKIRRDVYERGHAIEKAKAEIDRRLPDRVRFIMPQAKNADLVFSLVPLHPKMLDSIFDKAGLPRLKLRVLIAHGTPYERLIRTLVGVCGVHVEVAASAMHDPVDITLEGDVDADDVKFASEQLHGNTSDLLATVPVWQGGATGLMQLFVLNQIAHVVKRRLS